MALVCEASFASEKQRTAAPKAKLASLRVRGPAPSGSATLLGEPEPQTPSSALRGRRGIAIIELRRAKALREFSRWLKAWVFIEAGV